MGIEPVGRLLLIRQPNDWEVECRFGWVLVNGYPSYSAILNYISRLQKKYPHKKYDILPLLADVYSRMAYVGKEQEFRNKEIALYEELLREYRRRPQTPRIKAAIKGTAEALAYAHKNRMDRR